MKRWCIEETRRVQGIELLRFGKDSLTSHHMFDPVNRANCAGKFWRDLYRDKLYIDLTSGESEEEVVEMVKWVTWDSWPGPSVLPYRSYLISASSKGLSAYFVPSAEEHKALIASGMFGTEPERVPIETIRAFKASPDPESK